MSQSFKTYRADARIATRQLLDHKGNEVVASFIARINAAKTEAEVSRIMVDVRRAI
jgi:hypothetical protein